MIPVRRRRFSAWLALLAMLMLVVAPTISQSMSATRALEADVAALVEYCGHDQGDAGHGDHHGAVTGAECGYCTLSAHTPVLPLTADSRLFSTTGGRQTSGLLAAIKPFSGSAYPPALPRAPPFPA